MRISIKKYLGRLEEGIIALVVIQYNDSNYECSYWYDKDNCILTLEDDLAEIINDDIYEYMIGVINEKIAPFHETYDNLKEI
jgi:hypothetical protein